MGAQQSKVQTNKKKHSINPIEYQLKLTTLEKYITYQGDKVRNDEVGPLEQKLTSDMKTPNRNPQMELTIAARIVHEQYRLRYFDSALEACQQLSKKLIEVEMMHDGLEKITPEVLLAIERILFVINTEGASTLGTHGIELKKHLIEIFGSKIIENFEKYQRLSAVENIGPYLQKNYTIEEINNYLLRFSKIKGLQVSTSTPTFSTNNVGGGGGGGQAIQNDFQYQPYNPQQYSLSNQYQSLQQTTPFSMQNNYDPYNTQQNYGQMAPNQTNSQGISYPTFGLQQQLQYNKPKNYNAQQPTSLGDPSENLFAPSENLFAPVGFGGMLENNVEDLRITPEKANLLQQLTQSTAKMLLINPALGILTQQNANQGKVVDLKSTLPKIEEEEDPGLNSPSNQIHNKMQPDFNPPLQQIDNKFDDAKPMLTSVALRPSLNHFYDPNQINWLDQKRNELKRLGKNFIDDDFAPYNKSTLAHNPDRFMSDKKFVWVRLDKTFNPKITLFDKIQPDVIKQGSLGVCYLLSGLAALAENPQFLKRLIYPKELCVENIYAVTLCDSGEWKTIIIDDFVPCYDYNKQPAFSRNVEGDNGIWVSLIEKAYAKLFKSYQAIVAGSPTFALNSLTGAPTDFFDFEDADESHNKEEAVWQYLHLMLVNGYLTVASSTDETMNKSKLRLSQKGIVKEHAYTVLGICEVKTPDGVPDRIIKLRNPWGKMEWQGAWSDDSPLWTPESKAQVGGLESKNDGIFWINVKDFLKCFSDISTCKFHPTCNYSFIKVEKRAQIGQKNLALVKFKVKKSMATYITVFQKERRHFNQSNKKYEYSFLRANLVKLAPNKSGKLEIAEHINAEFQAKHALTFEHTLKEGEYLLMVEVFWCQDYYNDIVIGGYSEDKIVFEDLSSEKAQYPNIMEQICYKFLMAKLNASNDKPIKPYEYKGCPEIKRYNSFKLDGVWFCYFENKSKDSTVEETFKIEVDRLDITEVITPINHSQGLTFDLKLQPGDTMLIAIKIKSGDALKLSFQTSFKIKTVKA